MSSVRRGGLLLLAVGSLAVAVTVISVNSLTVTAASEGDVQAVEHRPSAYSPPSETVELAPVTGAAEATPGTRSQRLSVVPFAGELASDVEEATLSDEDFAASLSDAELESELARACRLLSEVGSSEEFEALLADPNRLPEFERPPESSLYTTVSCVGGERGTQYLRVYRSEAPEYFSALDRRDAVMGEKLRRGLR